MDVPDRFRGGWTAWPIVIIIAVLALVFLLYLYLSRPGGRPHSLHLHPPGLVLVEDVPQAVQVLMVLNHPLPTVNNPITWDVDIDEDDPTWDDDLYDVVTVAFGPGAVYASGSFDLTCKDLDANGFFDLHGAPGADVSDDEATHFVHAEGPGDNSRNISVTCISQASAAGASGTSGPDGN